MISSAAWVFRKGMSCFRGSGSSRDSRTAWATLSSTQ